MSRAVEFTLTTVIVMVVVATTTFAILLFLSGGFQLTGSKFGLLSGDLEEVAAETDVSADAWGICKEGWAFSRAEGYEPDGDYKTKQACIDDRQADFNGPLCALSPCACRCKG